MILKLFVPCAFVFSDYRISPDCGIILVLSMLIIPAAAAKLLAKTFTNSLIISVIFGGISAVSGLYLSYYFNLPSGPSMSLVSSGIFVLAFLTQKLATKSKLLNG